MPAQWNLFSRVLLAACAMHALCSVGAEVTEPSNCSPARGHIRASSFYRDSGPSSQIYDTHSVSAILMYNGEDTELPVYFEGNGYDIAIPESQGDTVACLHLELRDKKNASIVFQRTQSIAFWVLSSEYDAAHWRPRGPHRDRAHRRVARRPLRSYASRIWAYPSRPFVRDLRPGVMPRP